MVGVIAQEGATWIDYVATFATLTATATALWIGVFDARSRRRRDDLDESRRLVRALELGLHDPVTLSALMNAAVNHSRVISSGEANYVEDAVLGRMQGVPSADVNSAVLLGALDRRLEEEQRLSPLERLSRSVRGEYPGTYRGGWWPEVHDVLVTDGFRDRYRRTHD